MRELLDRNAPFVLPGRCPARNRKRTRTKKRAGIAVHSSRYFRQNVLSYPGFCWILELLASWRSFRVGFNRSSIIYDAQLSIINDDLARNDVFKRLEVVEHDKSDFYLILRDILIALLPVLLSNLSYLDKVNISISCLLLTTIFPGMSLKKNPLLFSHLTQSLHPRKQRRSNIIV